MRGGLREITDASDIVKIIAGKRYAVWPKFVITKQDVVVGKFSQKQISMQCVRRILKIEQRSQSLRKEKATNAMPAQFSKATYNFWTLLLF